MVQDLNNLDTEDLIFNNSLKIFTKILRSDLAARSTENVRGFDDCDL